MRKEKVSSAGVFKSGSLFPGSESGTAEVKRWKFPLEISANKHEIERSLVAIDNL